MTTVTPWHVKGNIDYQKIIRTFGVQPLEQKHIDFFSEQAKKKKQPLHHFLTRNIFFAHRDVDILIEHLKKKQPLFVYTGRSPSNNMHLGHLLPMHFTKWLQDVFDCEVWIQFPDEEKFLFKKELEYETIQHYMHENMLDIIAVGFNPQKTHFLVDTHHASLLYKQATRVAKHITFSTVKSVFGFTHENNIGSIFYTAMQAVPCFLPHVLHQKPYMCLIPHAIDQDPHFRVTRDVVHKLGYPKPASIQCRFLPGLGGMQHDGKMSSSGTANQAIFTTDTPAIIKKKINKYAFSGGQATVEEHRRLGGNPHIDIAYQWLTFFEQNDELLTTYFTQYKRGELLSGQLKALCIACVTSFLEQHQHRRKEAHTLIDTFMYKHNNKVT
ncbi:MAG: tryptophan--tRNA ligase [Candidatus Woesearchaeota archaeon]